MSRSHLLVIDLLTLGLVLLSARRLRQSERVESGTRSARIGMTSPEPTRSLHGSLERIWTRPIKAVRASRRTAACGDLGGDGRPEIVVPEPGGAAVFDETGKRLRTIPLPNFKSFLAIGRTSRGPQLIAFEIWGDRVDAFDSHGGHRWSYSAKDGIDWVAPVDVGARDGDAIAIGYNGDGGVRLLNANGTLRWHAKGPGNVWSVGSAKLSPSGPASVICPGDNRILVYDFAGHKTQELGPADAGAVFGGDIDGDGIDEVFGLGTTQVSGSWLWCFGADGKLRWRASARSQYASVDRPIAVGRLVPGGTQVAVGIADGSIYIYGRDGKPLPGIIIKPDLTSFCILPRPNQQTDALIAVSNEAVACYAWKETAAAGLPVLPPPPLVRRPEADPLAEAVYRNDLSRATTLLSTGANVNVRSRQGSPILIVAISRGFHEIAKTLIERGADVNARSADGQTPLLAATDDSDLTKILLQHGADPNLTYTGPRLIGITPLMSAAMDRNAIVARLLLENGAKVNAADDRGYTSLHWAATESSVETVEVLLARNADVNRRNWLGETPLHVAALYGSLPIVKSLIARGANVNARMDRRRIEYWGAKFTGSEEIAHRLERQGVLRVRREDGPGVLDRASSPEVAALLKSRGARRFMPAPK